MHMNHTLKALGLTVAGVVLGVLLIAGLSEATPPSQNQALVFHRTSSLTANNDVFSTDISPTGKASLLRIWVSAGTGSVVNVTMDDGSNTETMGLNGSTALVAGDLNAFDVPAVPGYTYNVQFETTQSTGFDVVFVQEIEQ